jgi:uncharacterized protein YjbI with pentapeptide repeats
MQETYTHDREFDQIDFTESSLIKGEYEKCTFDNCNFNECDLSKFKFIDCNFIGCNLSSAKINNTVLQEVKFKGCKLLGLQFDSCDDFILSFSFENCQLHYSSFFKTKIKKTIFKNSTLHQVDFSEADLTGVIFENCNLENTLFNKTILDKADFQTAYGFSIDPEINKIRKAKFSSIGIKGLLDKYDIEIE